MRLSVIKNSLNPIRLLSPLFLKFVSIEDVPGQSQPVIYQNSQEIDCPGFVSMPVPPHMAFIKGSTHKTLTATFRIVDNLVYSADFLHKNMLLTNNRRLIIENSSTMRDVKSFNWLNAYRTIHKEFDGLNIIFRGVSNGYYHTLIDNLPRLMALYHPECPRDKKIRLLIPKQCTVVETEIFSRVLPENVFIEIVQPGKTYRMQRCLFATFATRQFSGYVPSGVRDWLKEKLLPDRPRKKDKLIYITRSGAARRRLINEDEVVKCVSDYGFVVYKLEELTFLQQAELFYDAKCVVGLHGAGFTNLVFSEDVSVLEVFPYKYVKPSYYLMTLSVGGKYSYMVGSGEELNVDIVMPMPEFKQKLTEIMTSI